MDPFAQGSVWVMVALSGLVGGLVDLRSATDSAAPRHKRTKGQWLGATLVVVGTVAAFVGFGLVFTALTEDTTVTERNAAPGAVTFISALAITFSGIGVMAWSSARASDAGGRLPRVADDQLRTAPPTATYVETSSANRKVA